MGGKEEDENSTTHHTEISSSTASQTDTDTKNFSTVNCSVKKLKNMGFRIFEGGIQTIYLFDFCTDTQCYEKVLSSEICIVFGVLCHLNVSDQ